MTDANRWSIAELQARYELEPELTDVFVEGSFDREVLAQVVTKQDSRHAFYEIDTVDMPANILIKHGLSSGNKQRVIALSREFDALPQEAKVTCLIDRDLDHWFGSLSNTRRLRWSSYCSLECHFLTSETISDIVITTGRAKIKKVDIYISSLIGTLRQLFALRLADRDMGLSLKWVALRKYLSRTGDTIVFDIKKYSLALLSSNSKASRLNGFQKLFDEWYGRLAGDIRLAARGHDFTELLAWSIAEFGGQKEIANEVAIERIFVLLARAVSTLSDEFL